MASQKEGEIFDLKTAVILHLIPVGIFALTFAIPSNVLESKFFFLAFCFLGTTTLCMFFSIAAFIKIKKWQFLAFSLIDSLLVLATSYMTLIAMSARGV